MKLSEAITFFLATKRLFFKKSTLRNYKRILDSFIYHIGNIEIIAINTDDVLAFINKTTEGAKQSTKRLRYSLLSAFFNFIINSIDPEFRNPCDNPMLRKLFRHGKPIQ